MNRKPKAALLPLYIELYDKVVPQARAALESFLRSVAGALSAQGIDVDTCPVCRLEPEFREAVARIDADAADIIITLHLAYSPSLESIDALVQSPLPILILDTTPDAAFGTDVDPALIMNNHGIHGVQDLACMLRRRGRHYEIVAGHWETSAAIARAADIARAAYAAKRLRHTRALRIGDAFRGMGDFSVNENVLRDVLDVAVTQIAPQDLAPYAAGVTDEMVDAEMAADRARFDVVAAEDVHRRSVLLGLALRRCLDEHRADAFSANFLAFDSAADPVGTVPFLEISKAMARGIGYAGEGDVLTAALVGALLAGFEQTTFTEIFCPDWSGGTLFLSHMGEINPAIAAGKPVLREKDFPYTAARNPAFITCAPAPGPATFVNLAPGPQDSFRLIVAPVDVLGDATNPKMHESIRGWIRPRRGVVGFLEEFSRLGGTHHSALVLGSRAESIAAFARFAGLEPRIID